MDYRINLSTGKTVSFSGLRLTCTDTECDVSTLIKRYDLTKKEGKEIETHLLDMFSFLYN